MNITIYGFMGVGKTTVGKLLAFRLDYDFIDMDAEIEKNEGILITDIFRLYGERKFRQIESDLVKKLSGKEKLVISCGGGVVANPVNAEILKDSSKMIYLTATIDEIIKRTSLDKSRPLLDVKDPLEMASKLYESRKPIYERYADVKIDTTGKSPLEVVEKVLEEL